MNQLKSYLSGLYTDHQDLTNISLLVILTFIVFYNSLGNYYSSADDFNNLLHSNRDFWEAFVTNTYGETSGGDYRPIEVLSHQFDRYFYGDDNPLGRRLTNLIMHIFNVILVYILGFCLIKKKIYWISGRIAFRSSYNSW